MPTAGDASKTPEALGIDQMYKIYEKLNVAADKTTLEPEFRELLKAVGRSDKEKRLASQFIARFFDGFPLLYNEAINALLDLCEEEDSSIRKQVVKDLVTVCKKVATFVPKIADVFGQLMQTTDSNEFIGLQTSLTSLFHIDAQAALVGVFSQISNSEESIREKLIKFLGIKFKDLGPEIITLELEKSLLVEFKQVALDLSRDDFSSLANIVIGTKYVQNNLSGQQAFLDMISELIDFEKDFDGTDPAHYDQLLLLSKQALPFISSQISATQFLKYYCLKVLPKLDDRYIIDDSENLYLNTLMYMSDFASHVKQIDSETATKCLEIIYPKLIDVLPLPDEEDKDSIPKFEFCVIECYLFMMHKLGAEAPEFLSNEERIKDLRIRLQYLARGTQAYMKTIREDLSSKKDLTLKNKSDPDTRLKISALKMTANITAVIRELFHTPPLYKSKLGLSWRPILKSAEKRKAIEAQKAATTIQKPRISMNQDRERDRVLYQPPSGKFSNRTDNYTQQSSNYRPRGTFRGGRGNFRGSYRGGRF